jgi:hypothetical protein
MVGGEKGLVKSFFFCDLSGYGTYIPPCRVFDA